MDDWDEGIKKLNIIMDAIANKMGWVRPDPSYNFEVVENHPSIRKLDLEPVDFVKEAEKLDISKELKMLGLTDEVDENRALTGSWPGEEQK